MQTDRPRAVECPYCGSRAVLTDGKAVYGTTRFGAVWTCERYPRCDAYVGLHPNSTRPKGSLANAELREWRKAAHAAFDPLWRGQSAPYTRREAYRYLAQVLDVSIDRAHIAQLSVEQCRQVVEARFAANRAVSP